jgi:nuclear pore complex protein Nup133
LIISVSHGYLEEAASLAEKYLEFNALVKICEATNDSARLEMYMDKFADQVK